MEKFAVIMSGGSGKRLWPLSRLNKPKQFVDLLGDGPLLTNTINRLLPLYGGDHIIIIGTKEHRKLLLEYTSGLIPSENVLFEPAGRNTSACIALAAAHLTGQNDAVMSIFPSDHYVGDVPAFHQMIAHGMRAAEKTNNIVTIGIEPTFDATGYGYIHLGKPLADIDGAWNVDRFVEKPNKDKAKIFFDSGEYLWNGGIFLSKVSVMRNQFEKLLPNLFQGVQNAYQMMQQGEEDSALRFYKEVENIPIDIGIMEKSNNIIVFPGKFAWNDVGSFPAIHEILKNHEGNAIIEGNLIAHNASNLTISAKKKIVVASHVENLVIIDTDDVLYICNAKDAEKTKNLVETLADYEHSELE